MTYLAVPTPITAADHTAIAATLGGSLHAALGARYGKDVLTVDHMDGCRSLALLTDQGNGTVRVWAETDLGAIEYAKAFERHGLYWFVDLADLPTGPACERHTSAHWRAQHTHLAAPTVLAA